MQVSFHPDAVADASGSRQWYDERSPRAAGAFSAELERAVASLRDAPLRWPVFAAGTRRLLLRRFPFALIYRLGLDEVQVIAVAHLHRRPGFWQPRLQE